MSEENFAEKRETVRIGDIDVEIRSLNFDEMAEVNEMLGEKRHARAIIQVLRFGIVEPRKWKENAGKLNASVGSSLCAKILALTSKVENPFNPSQRKDSPEPQEAVSRPCTTPLRPRQCHP